MTLDLSPRYGPAWWSLDLFLTCGFIFWLHLGLISLLCHLLPYNVDSWLDLATISWSCFLTQVLWGSLWLVGPIPAVGSHSAPGLPSLREQPCSSCSLPDLMESLNLTDTSCTMRRSQQNKWQPRWLEACLRYDLSLLQSHGILVLAKPFVGLQQCMYLWGC